MTSKEIQNIRVRIAGLIDARRLGDAIKEIKDHARRRNAYKIIDRLEKTEESYGYMLRYIAEGVNDPDRDSVYASIVADLYAALDALAFFLEKAENTSLYYSTIRLYELNPEPDRIGRLLKEYAEVADKMSIFSLVSTGNADEKDSRRKMERLQAELFKAIWTQQHFSAGDADTVGEALASAAYTPEFKRHMVSALTLGLMQQFDARKLSLLISAYMDADDARLSSAALVGMLLGLWKYRSRPLPKNVADQLAAAKDMPSWKSDLRIAFIELIRARDTERINRKIRDEVIPDMMNLKPDILNKINDGKLASIDISTLQENPEWQELLDKNGVTERLKELTEIQMEGGDVMMSTFAHLKQFPFFNDIANWFLPFSASHTLVAGSAERANVVADMVEAAVFLCDNDKYSFMFAMEMVPKEQRDLMTSQFQSQSEGIYEAMGQAQYETSPEARRKAVNSYMQNIYRFFKLYSRRGEFFDPFDKGVNLISVPALAPDFDDPELLQVVAEFYFKLGYMRDALDVFGHMESLGAGDAQRYQKMGYCAERLKDYKQAIGYYQKAELLDARNTWTAKRLAACYRATGDKEMAQKYYQRLAADNPDDLSLAMLYGYVLTENGDYEEALHQFYKVEFLDEKTQKAWRPLAWILFLTGDFETSKSYYAKIAAHNPTAGDYLNMGHVALASGDMRNAVNSYALSVEANGGDQGVFLQSLADDAAHLKKAGVDPKVMPLIADAVFYKIAK